MFKSIETKSFQVIEHKNRLEINGNGQKKSKPRAHQVIGNDRGGVCVLIAQTGAALGLLGRHAVTHVAQIGVFPYRRRIASDAEDAGTGRSERRRRAHRTLLVSASVSASFRCRRRRRIAAVDPRRRRRFGTTCSPQRRK